MSKVFIEESTLTSIGDAIRAKTGKSDLIPPGAMPTEIESIETGGGGADLPEEAFLITGDCNYRFANGGWDWFIRDFGDKIQTQDITNAYNMFFTFKLEEIPFEINCKADTEINCENMFSFCDNLKSIPKINNLKPNNMAGMFYYCDNVRYFPENFGKDFDWSKVESSTSASSYHMDRMFSHCHSLRALPMEMLQHGNPAASYAYSFFDCLGENCYALDEMVNLPIPYTAAWKYNGFSHCGSYCNRLKNFTFETNEDGTPKVVQWKSQTIDFKEYIGYAYHTPYVLDYNSGITADKQVTDDTTYQALKDDPDWFTSDINYSRYNHDSAVATINSLPDTSAYLASAGGTNTIKFNGISGRYTDGGAINTLTEEEIAVAAAKGWTVTFV